MTNSQEWLREHTGELCSECGISYALCTKKILDLKQRPCCDLCGEEDTHNTKDARKAKPRTKNATSKAVEKKLRKKIVSEVLDSINSMEEINKTPAFMYAAGWITGLIINGGEE